MRILGIERDSKACNYYRILNPLEHIEDQGLADVVLLPHGSDLSSDDAIQKVFETDIVLLPRPSSEEWFGFVKAAQKAGKIIVADYDDDPFTCSPMNPYYRWIGVEEYVHPEYGPLWKDKMIGKDGVEWFNIEKNINRRDMLRASFRKADLATCTTPELKDVFSKINPNTVVLPNFINLEHFPKPDMKKGKVRIGWQGGVSHYEDLHFLKDVVSEIGKRDDVEIVYFGDFRLATMFKGVKNLDMQNWVAHIAYPYKLALLNIDIGLCPLIDNEFNTRKSAIKYYEYSAVGAATVASNINPYKAVMTNNKDGMLVDNDPSEWISVLNDLINDKIKVKDIADSAYKNIKNNYTIQKNAHLWTDAYKKVIEQQSVLQEA